MSRAWYAYNNVGDPFLPNSWFYSNVKPVCINGFTPCALYATFSGFVNPSSLSLNLQIYIANGLVSGVAQPVGAVKKYFYLKP